MCRIAGESLSLFFSELLLSLCLSAALLSCQLLCPWATNLSNLCTAVYNSGRCITAKPTRLAHCCVMLGGFPSSVFEKREHFCVSNNSYRTVSQVYVSCDHELQQFRHRFLRSSREEKKNLFSCENVLWIRRPHTLSVCSSSRLIASITSKFSCGWTALISMCAAPTPSVLFVPT